MSRDFMAVNIIKTALEAALRDEAVAPELRRSLSELDRINAALSHWNSCAICLSAGAANCHEARKWLGILGPTHGSFGPLALVSSV